ncbi:MAG TPA: bifunctional serine/threonine-protein kinase/formylglycine-generating enzyme family protein [Kofleriaceae bacterium]|nr:bifunctional serine/threonine-protein kinase/formylglycine-generating enzyme family protein [Kofleriaceae bacterium]
MSWEPPTEFEEYRIIRPLGSGAMGLVFLAHDTLLDRPVAIKFISAHDIGAAARERFFTEGRAVARLSHPNVVAVYRVGEVKQRPYLISEYVRGTSLAAIAKPIPWERALKIGIGLARGLGAAHRRGVLHRDIKPANVVLGEDDEAKLLDFGLAKLVSADPAALPPRPPELGELYASRVSATAPPYEPEAVATISLATSPGGRRGRERVATASLTPAPGAGLTRPGAGPTQDGTIVGTPLYIAPELWRRAPASQASDVYALGVVLYELLAGFAPFAGLSIHELAARVPYEDAPPVAGWVENLPARLAEVIDACVSRDPAQRPGSGDALGDLLESVLGVPAPAPDGSPYRGLSTFEAEHRGVFFGRAAEARTVVERLRTETFVIVAGDSGAGKSSLCRAAVLPAIAEKSLAGKRWRATTVIPGVRPLDRLDAALAERSPDEGLLLFVDQLEELLTIAEPAQAALVAEYLADLVTARSDVRVLASARSDFLGRLACLPGLGELVGRALFLLGPLGDRGLREAIVGPARALGYTFEDAATIDDLVASGRRHLPLLQFALAELWDARDTSRRVIPAGALARIGGVTGALARHADGVLAGLPSGEHAAARTILIALVTAEGTRARRTHSELLELAARQSPRTDAALDALVRGRLLVAQRADSGESVYAIAHEALLHGWDVLRGWVSHDAERRAVRQRTERAAADWDQLGRPRDALWSERLLQEATSIDEESIPSRAAAFLRASRHRAARRRARRWAIAISAPLVVAAAVLGLRLQASRDRDAAVTEARVMLSAARAGATQLDDLRRDAFAKLDGHQPEPGEQLWRETLRAEQDVERAYASAAARLEQILQEAPRHAGARALMADVLFERARLADQGGRALERDDLVRRLAMYSATDRWNAPAHLAITTEPPGAAVSLWRYDTPDIHDTHDTSGERFTQSPELRLGTTPIAEQDVLPGSILLEFTQAGRAPVRLPVLLGRGEAVRLAIKLPPEAAIPAGFVYVPAGRFLYGSAGSEEARASYDSQPIHTVETGPYLIARNETTFGEWIEFLRALPRAERAKRTPDVNRRSFNVALSQRPDGTYQLALGLDGYVMVAKEGEPLRYPGRTARAVQDWSRLPISGVSFDDTLAYMAWLRDSGRVPRARHCSEHEWERAARGADGRAFPGGARLDPEDANFNLTYGKIETAFGPDEVGSHPASDSPFGVHDLAGNVWEWTTSVDDAETPVARGGSFFQAGAYARAENRSVDIAHHRNAFYGVRVCATATR